MPRQIPISQQLNDIVQAIFDVLDESIRGEHIRDIGEWVAYRLVQRARSGRTAKRAGGNLKKLKKLSRPYKEFRKRSKNLNRSLTTPTKSNLTFTGQLLNSIKFRTRKGLAIIAPEGRRTDGKTNKKVALYVQAQGRPFLFLGRRDVNELARLYGESLQDLINSNKVLK